MPEKGGEGLEFAFSSAVAAGLGLEAVDFVGGDVVDPAREAVGAVVGRRLQQRRVEFVEGGVRLRRAAGIEEGAAEGWEELYGA